MELDETAALLRAFPQVTHAVVQVYGTGEHRQRVAFITPEQKQVTRQTIETICRQEMPTHLVPDRIIILKTTPLNPDGSIDHQALTQIAQVADQQPAADASGTRTEQRLLAVCDSLMNGSTLSEKRHSLVLNGCWLSAFRLRNRIRTEFQIDLPLASLFGEPQLSELARAIDSAIDSGQEPRLPLPKPTTTEGPTPLSFSQKRLWFLETCRPRSSQHHRLVTLRLNGNLSLANLTKACTYLIQRHQVLRTRFIWEDSTPVQVFEPEFTPIINLGVFTQSDDGLNAARVWLNQEAQRTFDLASGPLVRFHLAQAGIDDHLFMINAHQLIVDEWSLKILVKEWMLAYGRLHGVNNPDLSETPLRYRDFCIWQIRDEVRQSMSTSLEFWSKELAGMDHELQLATDFRPPQLTCHLGAQLDRQLSSNLSGELYKLARRPGLSLFAVLLGLYQILLARYSGQKDFGIGTPTFGRPHPDLENTIGQFANSLVIRSDLNFSERFLDLADKVSDRVFQAFAHEDCPFEKVVETLNPIRKTNRNPLFQTMFVFTEADKSEPPLPELTLSPNARSPVGVPIELVLTCTLVEGHICFSMDYDKERFLPETIEDMLANLNFLAEQVVDSPRLKMDDLVINIPTQIQNWLRREKQAEKSLPELTAHELFSRTAKHYPKRLAYQEPCLSLTYEQIEQQATQLAQRIAALKFTSESPVAVFYSQSAEMLIAMLAIMKAGHLYVPIDPTLPLARQTYILEDCGCRLVIGEANHTNHFNLEPTPIWEIELNDQPQITGDWQAPSVHPNQLAYMIYTSGSTGHPKGTQLTHRGLANLAIAQSRFFEVTPESRVLLFASSGFDASLWEIFMAIAVGAAVIPLEESARQSLDSFTSFIHKRNISAVTIPPALLAKLNPRHFPKSCHVISAGERCPDHLARMWAKSRTIFNAYGPTEVTVCASIYRVNEHGLPGPDSGTPIGKPLDRLTIHLLDDNLHSVPRGVAGELYVAGIGLARGYHRRPALTAQRFLPEPFSGNHGRRMYRTMDLARLLPSGNLTFLKRVDRQIKIRGYRIEIGEIEQRLSQFPEIDQVMVLPESEGPSVERLNCFLIPSQPLSGRWPSRLAFKLQQFMPPYMIPSGWFNLLEWPMTVNGKIDRKELRRLAQEQQSKPRTIVPNKASPLEKRLMDLWQKILCTPIHSVERSFFELGGHSLNSIELLNELNTQFNQKLTLSHIFCHHTIRAMARFLEQPIRPLDSKLLVVINKGVKERTPVVLVHGSEGNVQAYTPLAKWVLPEQPIYALQARGLNESCPRYRTIEELAQSYVEELVHFLPAENYHLGGWSMGGLIALEMARQLRSRGRLKEPILLIDPPTPNEFNQAVPHLDQRLQELPNPPPDDLQATMVELGRLPLGQAQTQHPRLVQLNRLLLKAVANYRPEPIPIQIHLIQPSLGQKPANEVWSALVGGERLKVIEVQGDHFSIMKERGFRNWLSLTGTFFGNDKEP